MITRSLLLLFWISIVSCQKKQEEVTSVPSVQKVVPKKATPEIDIHDCTTAEDTIFKDGDWVKYIKLNEKDYGVEIRFGGITDTLDDCVFDCNEVNGLIPQLFRKEKELILSRGQGFTYRQVIVCRKESNKLVYSQFESGRTASDSYDYLVFETHGRFCFYNRENSREFYKDILPEFKGLKVISSEVFNDKIVVYFENKKTFTVKLPKRKD